MHRLSCVLLERVASGDRKGKVLIIGHGTLPLPDCPSLQRDERGFGLALRLHIGASQGHGSTGSDLNRAVDFKVDCASGDLPFQEGVFRSVILYHVTRDGREPELAEASRVLLPGGEILIVGINQKSWRGMQSRLHVSFPALRMARLRESLQYHGMNIVSVLGAGLAGQPGPLMEHQRISRLALPFADLLLVKARHCQRPLVRPLRLKEFSAGAVPTAMVMGCQF